MSGRLFVVATPLGNLEDLSPRAERTLSECAVVACEDTRRTGALLRSRGIRTPVTSFFEHNERSKGARVLAWLAEGKDVALVSDAGTPAISDPGFRLVRDARGSGIAVVPVPGPCAAIAALSVSGLPTDRFLFVGFLPKQGGARRKAVSELCAQTATLVLYESPLRVIATLDELRALLGDREAFLCREATKLHEEYRRGRLSALAAELRGRAGVKGEIVLVVAGAAGAATAAGAASDGELDALFEELAAAGRSRREAAREIGRRVGLPAREVYRRLLRDRR